MVCHTDLREDLGIYAVQMGFDCKELEGRDNYKEKTSGGWLSDFRGCGSPWSVFNKVLFYDLN